MNKVSNLFTKHFRNFHFIAIIVSIVILFAGEKIVTPYLNQTVYMVFYYPFAKLNSGFLELISVSEDNAKLSQALIDVSMKISLYEESALENERLRSILGFEPPPNYTMVPAKVIAIAGEYIPITATINKGSNDSVWIDQPVINQQGLIGRVTLVSPDFSVVQLLTDPSNRVAGRIVSSREMGIVKYNTNSGMYLDNFPIQGNIRIDDQIISSGLGGVYPAGLVVGIVTEVIKEDLEPFLKVKVLPAANFFSLEEIFILREIK